MVAAAAGLRVLGAVGEVEAGDVGGVGNFLPFDFLPAFLPDGIFHSGAGGHRHDVVEFTTSRLYVLRLNF